MNDKVTTLISQAFESLTTSLEAGKSGQLLTYLAFCSRFHHYSFNNVLLIALQRPEATHVAGFVAWKKMNRYVKKGEKGIAIMVPLIYRRKDQEAIVEEPEATVCGFTTGYVFDIVQTEGEPVPEFASVKGDPGCYLMRLHDFARDNGIVVTHKDTLRGARGLSKGGSIELLAGLTPAEEFQILAHEIGHELLHKGERRKETTTTVREAEAEAVAYVVCCAVGLDTGTASSDYVQLYQGDADLLRRSLEHVRSAASTILSRL